MSRQKKHHKFCPHRYWDMEGECRCPCSAVNKLAQLENGPFYFGKVKDNCDFHIYSHDFKHDVMIVVNGDFEDEDAAIEYARAMVDVLNNAVVGEQKS